MAEMHEWDEPGFWNKKPKAGLTHVSVPIKDIVEKIQELRWDSQNNDFVEWLQKYLPED